MKNIIKYTIYITLIPILIYIGLSVFASQNNSISLKTDLIKRASITNTVTATGSLKALVTVEVGTQVSGKIEQLLVNYNSSVKKGQLLARLDTEALESTLASSKASLDLAQAEYNFRKSNYDRNKTLIDKQLIAQQEFDEIEYAYKSAEANLQSANAKYQKDKTNLNYAFIYSPIDGIVLEKNIEEGETVASSFETPTLFTIAKDLTNMQIEADVDEADIGQIKTGQRVEFTVDAFPESTFDGKVVEIHLMPSENSNVVTYTVIIEAQNPKQKLMPGMTANVSFIVTEKKNILVVPNLATQFEPDMALINAYKESHPTIKINMPEPPSQKDIPLGETKDVINKMIWIKNGNIISAQPIEIGVTDEINYEILSNIKEGTEVITAISSESPIENVKTEEGRSPFMPTPPGSNRKKKSNG